LRHHTGEEWEREEAPDLLSAEGKPTGSAPGGGRGPSGVTERGGLLRLPLLGAAPHRRRAVLWLHVAAAA
jgi:hypothetical protein